MKKVLIKKKRFEGELNRGEPMKLVERCEEEKKVLKQREERKKVLKQREDKNRDHLVCKLIVGGRVAVYGIRGLPVVFLAHEWERLLQNGEQIRDFIQQNASELNPK